MLNIDTTVGTRSRPARTEDAPSTVRRVCHSHGSDTKAAIDDLIARAESNRTLRDWLIEKGAKAAVGEIVRVENSTIIRPQAARTWAPNHAADAAQRDRAAKLDNIVAGALYNILLSANGRRVRLGDATKADLEFIAEARETQAKTMAKDALWYRAVAGRLTGSQTVQTTLKEKDLRAMQREAYESVA